MLSHFVYDDLTYLHVVIHTTTITTITNPNTNSMLCLSYISRWCKTPNTSESCFRHGRCRGVGGSLCVWLSTTTCRYNIHPHDKIHTLLTTQQDTVVKVPLTLLSHTHWILVSTRHNQIDRSRAVPYTYRHIPINIYFRLSLILITNSVFFHLPPVAVNKVQST
jgi:hypothetical protein